MTLSSTILENYHGAGAYLAALDNDGAVIAIRLIPEIPHTDRPQHTLKPGRLSKAETAIRIRAAADYWRHVEATREAWAQEIRDWQPAGTVKVLAADMSCTEFCGIHSRLAWLGKHALENDMRLPIIPSEHRDRAYAAESRLVVSA